MAPPTDSPYYNFSHHSHVDPHSKEANDRYGEHWGRCIHLSRGQDEQMCSMLKGELDNLLIFAALFSAIVAAFTIESYKWISNSGNPSPVSSPVAVQVNILWFFSLSASLGVASVGILCMQWVRQYQNGTFKSTKHGVALRHQRYNGFQKWRVPDIISMLPVLLHLSLVIFGVGLIRLLWEINRPVAATFMVGSILSTAFVLGTLFAPALQLLWIVWHPSSWVALKHFNTQCPYQSPQAWIGYLIIWPLTFKVGKFQNWSDFDTSWMNLVNRATRNRHSDKYAAMCSEKEDQPKDQEKDQGEDQDKDMCDHDYTDRMVEAEFVWLDREFRHDTAGIKARAEAFEQLSFGAAKGVVDALKLSLPEKPNPVGLKGVLYMKVWYLWAYALDRPGLDEAYMKARVQYMSELDQDITLPGRSLGRHLDVRSLLQDKLLVPRFLHCLETMVETQPDISSDIFQEMWNIIGDLIEHSFRYSYTEYLHSLGDLVQAFHDRLEPKQKPATAQVIKDTIDHILGGLVFLWKLHPDQPAPRLNSENSKHMEKLVVLVRDLNVHVSSKTKSVLLSSQPRPSQESRRAAIQAAIASEPPRSESDEKIHLGGAQKRNWEALIALLARWTEALEKERASQIASASASRIANSLDSRSVTAVNLSHRNNSKGDRSGGDPFSGFVDPLPTPNSQV